MKRAPLALLSILAVPLFSATSPAYAFETIDALPWPSLGRFPAYPRETPRPTNFFVEGGAMHDSNLLRLENGAQSDNVFRVGGGITHEQRIFGRQTLRLEARGDEYKFDRFSDLDHFAYSALADWRWEIGNQLSGSLAVGRDRRLADLAETQSTRRDLVTETRFTGTAGYLVTPRLRVRGGVGATSSDRSTRPDAEVDAKAVTVGTDYVSPLGNTLGVEYRSASGNAPVDQTIAPLGTSVSNDYDEHELSLVATYSPGTQLHAEGRLGRTHRTYTQLSGRDFDGTTGRGTVEWLPGNKTSLLFTAYREPRSIIDIAASHVLVQGYAFGPSWAATAKLVFTGLYLRERRKFEGDPTLTIPGTELRDELVQALRLGAGWEPQRHWQVGFSVDHGKRESNFANRDYRFTAVSANVAWRY